MFEMFEDPESEFYEPKKLLLFDGTYTTFRAFYGYSADQFCKKDGTPSNCIYGVAKTLLTLIGLEHPTHIAFAYDKGRAGHRKELLPQYKEGRKETPDELVAQFPIVKDMLKLADLPLLEQDRLEADDIIATLATQAAADNWEVRIFSSDKDMYQLVNDKVHVVRPAHGRAGFEQMDPSAIEKRYGLPPERYSDLAALTGESADNIPGVMGVGPKTALKWIQEYENLDNLLANADKIVGKVGDALRTSIDQVKLNRQVNELVRDADLSHTLGDLALTTPNLEKMNEFFAEWEMKSLINRFKW